MNLYLFNDNDSAATFGIGTYINELIHALESTGIHIFIVHLHSNRPEFEIEKTDDTGLNSVENWYIPEVRNHRTFDGDVQQIEDYFDNVIYLLRLYIQDTTDLVFHFNFNLCYRLAQGLKKMFNCKTVTTIHFMKWAFELQGNTKKLLALKSKQVNQMSKYEQYLYATDEYEKMLYKEVDRVIVLSQYDKNFLCSEYQIDAGKIFVIPNGLNDSNAVLESKRNELRRKWHVSDKESLILFVGRLHQVKGLIFLMRAFRKVLEKMPDCRLLIAGSGYYDIYIQEAKEISAKVSFTGFLDKKDLSEIYQIADVGVVPSLYEPFGYVAIEMMMHSLPIVATATSGLNEVVDEACGMKIPIIEQPESIDMDTDLLSEKILYLFQNSNEASKLGQNGRKRFLQEYSSEVFRRNMMEFYQTALNS